MENTHDSRAEEQADRRKAPSKTRKWALLPDFSKLLLIAVVLPVLSITTLHLWQSREVAREQYATRLADAARAHGREIDAFIQLHTATLQVVAERRTTTGNVDDEGLWAADLQRVHRYYPDFATLALIDAEGALVLTEPAAPEAPGALVTDRAYYTVPKRTGLPYVSDAYRGRVVSQLPSIALSVPFFASGRFAGVV